MMTMNKMLRRRRCRSVSRPACGIVLLVVLIVHFTSAAFLVDSKNAPPSCGKSISSSRFSRFLVRRAEVADEDQNNNNNSESGSRSSSASLTEPEDGSSSFNNEDSTADRNASYVESLLDNLTTALDKWILNGSPVQQERAHNILQQIQQQSMDDDYVEQAFRRMKRAGMPLPPQNKVELGKTDNELQRRRQAQERKRWEAQHHGGGTETTGSNVAERVGRSALSSRAAKNGKPDVFLGAVDSRLQPQNFAQDKTELEDSLQQTATGGFHPSSVASGLLGTEGSGVSPAAPASSLSDAAYLRSSELVALAGAHGFNGENLGIGGLDDVLALVKRRIWVPLAAPPQLLQELGIHPVRGLLLYGMPGCGKTLLARTIGKILSPARPVTVVSGPELMDKFVGSSEKNLREVFDNPPDIYDTYRLNEPDGGEALARAALHVIILDEFDAMARTRGGRDGKGDQGDAGVARDSVVNQLLAKMDGVDSLVVPTLVIGLTNKRSLIESALLRPGRFEVQIEVPPPRTMEARISILKVHTRQMFDAGRLLVRDAPENTASGRYVEEHGSGNLLSYDQLLNRLATECDGMSGASLAGVARAAASHALERAVEEFSATAAEGHPVLDCLVTQEDFEGAVKDVFDSSGDSDWASEDDSQESDQPPTAEDEGEAEFSATT
jgi:energy-coupling factor transporter ATP-binding protein EcfA2